MGGGYHISVDPSEMATRYSSKGATEDPRVSLDPLDPEVDIDTEEAASYFPREDLQTVLAPLLSKIPVREADLLEMYYYRHMRQADIAHVFGVTQAAISYRIERALHRIMFLRSVPVLTEAEIRRDIPRGPFKAIDVDILVGMWETTCQSAVALNLGLTQGRVRHRFFAAVRLLEKLALTNPLYEPYHQFFGAISKKNWNALRAVELPQWSGRGLNECS